MAPAFYMPHEPEIGRRKPGGLGKRFSQITGEPFNDRLPPPMLLLPIHDPLADAPIEVDQFPIDRPIGSKAALAYPLLNDGEEFRVVRRKGVALFFFGWDHFLLFYSDKLPQPEVAPITQGDRAGDHSGKFNSESVSAWVGESALPLRSDSPELKPTNLFI